MSATIESRKLAVTRCIHVLADTVGLDREALIDVLSSMLVLILDDFGDKDRREELTRETVARFGWVAVRGPR